MTANSTFSLLCSFILISLFSNFEIGAQPESVSNFKKQQWEKMAVQADGWTDKLGLPIDEKIKDTVIALNLLGVKTVQSCEGHIDWGSGHPWVSIDMAWEERENLLLATQTCSAKYKEEEEKLKHTYPQLDYNELLELSEAAPLHKLRAQIKENLLKSQQLEFSCMEKLQTLLSLFYKTHTCDYDALLIINEGWLESLGAKWQSIRSEAVKQEKLEQYQKEMLAFTQFLIHYYYEE